MNVTGSLRTLAGRLAGRHGRPAVVLMYHRVAAGLVDPWGLCVSPENFAAQLAVLATGYRTVPLRDLLDSRGSDRGRPLVAITFDDGYADNLNVAAPLLAGQGLPATFFLTSGLLGSPREFWWDELEQLLLGAAALPSRLEVPTPRTTCAFETGTAGLALDDPRSAASERVPWEAPPGTRLGLFYAIWSVLRTLGDDERRTALDDIGRQVGAMPSRRPDYRTLTREEARRLAAMPGAEIGAHSVSHASLPGCTPEEQLRQMHDSRRDLASLLGAPVQGFAYPFGDFSRRTIDLARSAGFDYACTTEAGCVTGATPRYRVPRIAVADWNGERFARRLQEVLR
jgi:peptidoglycan/xylan/chitin deacetylase (PgdA/CDA1 family)